MDEEEIEVLRNQSMAGLFMGFSIARKDDLNSIKKKKAPPLPPRVGNISEDSMEDMISNFDVDNIQQPNA